MTDHKDKDIASGIGLALLAVLIWSGNFVIARKVYRQIPPISLAFYRWLIASVIITPFAFNQFRKEWTAIKKSFWYLFWSALFGITLFNTLLYVGAHHSTAINLVLISATSSPIIATILAVIFLKEQMGWLKISGLFICIAGVLLLLSRGDFTHLISRQFSKGDLWILGAGFSFAAYNTLAKKKPASISHITYLFVIFSLGMILLFPFYWDEKNRMAAVNWDTELFLQILYLGLGASVISFWIWNIAISKLGAARTILFGNLIPIFSSIEAVLFLNEQFSGIQVISLLIVFAGIILANLRLRKK